MSTTPPTDRPDLQDATMATADDLMSIVTDIHQEHDHISELSLPEIEAVVEAVAQMVPAGNVPGLIASGLARLGSKDPSQSDVKRDVNMLYRGMQQMMDHAVFNVFFVGPAQVIWGYQKLLQLTGRNLDAAFPEGTWQFYVDYALREDTARFTIESDGFDTALNNNNLFLDDVDRMTTWVMTAIQTLHTYPALLENEWRERVYIRELLSLLDTKEEREPYLRLHDHWLDIVPYRRMTDARGDENYPAYRRRKFDEWLFGVAGRHLKPEQMRAWRKRVNAAKKTDLKPYIQQMNIHSYCLPDQYGETRTPVPLANLHVAVIYGDHYYLIPICKPDTTTPNTVEAVRGYMAAIVQHPSKAEVANLDLLAQIQRYQWEGVRRKLSNTLITELDMLRLCPIVLNVNPRNREQPLAEIRQTERGIGHHALTIFDTRESIVFDLSHIYYDASWAAALSEMMTNESLTWALKIANQMRSEPTERPYSPRLKITPKIQDYLERLEHTTPEVSAENDDVRVETVLELREMFKQRSDLLRLTVNDLLLLYRAIHAMSYQPSDKLSKRLAKLHESAKDNKQTRQIIADAIAALQPEQTSPAILMPVDASRQSPRDRLYPMSFEVPLKKLRLRELHQDVMAALSEVEGGGDDHDFDALQRRYLAALAGFGTVMRHAKEIANAGQSSSVGTIKLLAHLPTPLQHLLNQIPDQFDMLNDIIKGREVFSNVGQVAQSSTLTRFISAKDDNEKKDMAWGVLTDANGRMVITLRDFRPHVGALIHIGQRDIAQAMTQDYLRTYANGFNHYVSDLKRITRQSRETRMDA